MTYYIGDIEYCPTDELRHFGILGMKWGIRRWQNKDGSLTAAGYEHYGYGGKNKRKAEIAKNIAKAAAGYMKAYDADDAISDDPEYLKNWHKELKDYYDKNASAEDKAYLEKRYGDEAYQHYGHNVEDAVADIVGYKYYKDFADKYHEGMNEVEAAVAKLCGLKVNDFETRIGSELIGNFARNVNGTSDEDAYRYATDIMKNSFGVEVDGKEFIGMVRSIANDQNGGKL